MNGKTLMPAGWHRHAWLGFMIVASLVLSLGFACAAPFAAFAAISALTLDRRTALVAIGGVWLANQAAGYLALGYPLDANSLAWGAMIGLAAVAATVSARIMAAYFEANSRAAMTLAAFVVAFAAYEAALFVAAATLLGGTESFTIAIITRIAETNAITMAALLLMNWLFIPASGDEERKLPLLQRRAV
jgi:hypothetical protein